LSPTLTRPQVRTFRLWYYRLLYEVRDHQLIIIVIAVEKRDRSEVYKAVAKRWTAQR
jgi:mRNA-degrading endonuclease RelE of RelBE toxin-antitoxin system